MLGYKNYVRLCCAVLLGCLMGRGVQAETSIFTMPRVHLQHRQMQQQMMMLSRAGRVVEMEALCREAVKLLPQDATWRFNLACTLAYRQDKTEALEVLEQAIDLGFDDATVIAKDRDLAPLTQLPEFQALLEKARASRKTRLQAGGQTRVTTTLMGLPAEVNGTNTVWDFDHGCFRTLFKLMPRSSRKSASYAAEYHGPESAVLSNLLAAGTAAGNFGDLYINRDDAHSSLTYTNFPGLTPVVYSAEARQYGAHMSFPNALFGYPVLGNSSMALTQGALWRSLPRALQTDQLLGVQALNFYFNNQIWVYPAHKDYTPESGDLFPANSPYWFITKGSSYSDRPLVELLAAALAALQPQTKVHLVQQKLLAPTLQMLLRAALRGVEEPAGYLTRVAHPIVFDAQDVDASRLVRHAQALSVTNIVPPVALRVLQEETAQPGVDYFDTQTEKLIDSPCNIARVIRGMTYRRTMTLEAMTTKSARQQQFHWRILQGDEEKITLKPSGTQGERVELTIAYHGVYHPQSSAQRAATTLAPVLSSRVDIACFCQRGDDYSAPSILSFYYLPNEERVYRADGRILSVDYANRAHRYADPKLTIEKGWKDLYEYADDGQLLGWYRMRPTGNPEHFTPQGYKVLTQDNQGRPQRACVVEYLPREAGVAGLPPTLTWIETAQQYEFTYREPSDKVGVPQPVQ